MRLQRVRSKVSNAPSTISIAHLYQARFASKVASWKQNAKKSKKLIYEFFAWTNRNFDPDRMFWSPCASFFWASKTIFYVLWNPHSTILSRHIQQAELGFKVAHENTRFQKCIFGPDEIQKNLENQNLTFFVWVRLYQLQWH